MPRQEQIVVLPRWCRGIVWRRIRVLDSVAHGNDRLARKGFPAGKLGRLLALMHDIDHNGGYALLNSLQLR